MTKPPVGHLLKWCKIVGESTQNARNIQVIQVEELYEFAPENWNVMEMLELTLFEGWSLVARFTNNK